MFCQVAVPSFLDVWNDITTHGWFSGRGERGDWLTYGAWNSTISCNVKPRIWVFGAVGGGLQYILALVAKAMKDEWKYIDIWWKNTSASVLTTHKLCMLEKKYIKSWLCSGYYLVMSVILMATALPFCYVRMWEWKQQEFIIWLPYCSALVLLSDVAVISPAFLPTLAFCMWGLCAFKYRTIEALNCTSDQESCV